MWLGKACGVLQGVEEALEGQAFKRFSVQGPTIGREDLQSEGRNLPTALPTCVPHLEFLTWNSIRLMTPEIAKQQQLRGPALWLLSEAVM